jgi:hypothetical protein
MGPAINGLREKSIARDSALCKKMPIPPAEHIETFIAGRGEPS